MAFEKLRWSSERPNTSLEFLGFWKSIALPTIPYLEAFRNGLQPHFVPKNIQTDPEDRIQRKMALIAITFTGKQRNEIEVTVASGHPSHCCPSTVGSNSILLQTDCSRVEQLILVCLYDKLARKWSSTFWYYLALFPGISLLDRHQCGMVRCSHLLHIFT